MGVAYKQKCMRCKDKYVLANRRTRYVVCYDCIKNELQGEVKDPEMKKLFDIPEEYYKQNNFLCDLKIKYLRFNNLSEKQIEAFKKVVKEIEEEK